MAKNKTNESTEKRGPGRPPAMPGENMENYMFRVATDVPALVKELAEARGQSIGQALTLIVRQAAQKRTRDAARRAKAAN